MRLTVVGCSGSIPGPDSPASCYLVEAGGTRVLLDLGSGALGPLSRFADPIDLDAVLLSHLHADHCLDLCGLYVLRHWGPHRPAAPLPVWGPEGTGERLAQGYGVGPDPGLSEQYTYATYPAGPFAVGDLTVGAVHVEHPVEAFALRLEHEGRSLVYSGDTGESVGLVELASGADVLLCEAAWGTTEPTVDALHLSGRQAGEHARKAGVQRLVVTHVPPWYDAQRTADAAGEAFGGPVETARTGLVVEV